MECRPSSPGSIKKVFPTNSDAHQRYNGVRNLLGKVENPCLHEDWVKQDHHQDKNLNGYEPGSVISNELECHSMSHMLRESQKTKF